MDRAPNGIPLKLDAQELHLDTEESPKSKVPGAIKVGPSPYSSWFNRPSTPTIIAVGIFIKMTQTNHEESTLHRAIPSYSSTFAAASARTCAGHPASSQQESGPVLGCSRGAPEKKQVHLYGYTYVYFFFDIHIYIYTDMYIYIYRYVYIYII